MNPIIPTGTRSGARLFSAAVFNSIPSVVMTVFLATAGNIHSADPDPLLKQASDAIKAGRTNEAIALAIKATEAQPTNAAAWFFRGRLHETVRDHTNAIAAYDRTAALDPKPRIFQYRGAEHFRAGNFEKSVADFDRFIKLVPSQAPHHWQRGISLYYAGKFDEGRKQFESHQTVNPNDVENAVWHFLCAARASGVEQARASLIPIEGDPRVPMKEIHALFAGKDTPEQVLAAARGKQDAPPASDENPMFFAHLYLGLHYEAVGDGAKTREHILKAARDFRADHYMGDVARVHARLLEKRK